MKHPRFQALDGVDLAFSVPRGVNHRLALRAIQRVHEGGDAEIPAFLTKAETEFVAKVIAELEAHRPKGDAP